jgi:tRNA 2-selenouridine synthase
MSEPNPSGAIEVVKTADAATRARFDAIIDVRSPAEFAIDHVPGAESMPVLSNEERAVVGTIYVQESRFKARRLGAALVARNVARHLETVLTDRPGSFRPLVYCWRGGQRSNAMATILAQVGWRTAVLAGGYRTYRREVTARLYDAEPELRLVLLDGATGTGKTEVLRRLAARGVQVLDLEDLTQHRGSLFGALPGRPQPSQKMFESRLLGVLEQLDPSRPILVEAESSKIGERVVPPTLWKAMLAASRIELVAPIEARASYLAAEYRHLEDDRALLEEVFERLPLRGRVLKDWRRLADDGDFETIAGELMLVHYDPAYRRSARAEGRPRLAEIVLGSIGPTDLDLAADQVAGILASVEQGASVKEPTLQIGNRP